mgnify:CR=1 FL=1
MIKKIIFISLIFLNFFIQSSYSFQNQEKITIDKIKKNLIKTNSLSFHFKQKINDKTEIGRCLIKYPKLMHCYYDNKAKKELISDGYTLAIYKKKYNKIYLYPLITLTLNHLLNKEFILRELLPENHKRLKITDKIIEFEVYNKKQKIIVGFAPKSFDLLGWKTTDIFQNDVEFVVYDVKKNIKAGKGEFIIPKLN